MAFLPRNAAEFSDPNYWKSFFRNQRAPFEWYGSFDDIGEALIKYIRITDHILQIGCGNSRLASQLYDNGYKHVLSIDTNEEVIAEQRKVNKERTELTFACTSALQLDVDSETENVVLDKGTLDALLPPDYKKEQLADVLKMFKEIERVLVPSGRYIIVSLSQSHVLRTFVEHFSGRGTYMIRIQRVSNLNTFFMPVFFLIATKTRIPLPSLVLEYVHSLSRKPVRCSNTSALYSTIQGEQEYAWFVHRCQSKLLNEISVVMCDEEGREKYKIAVVDDADALTVSSYAVFIVPPGRNNEWLFSTEKGHRFLRAQCNVTRLAIVMLHREQVYGGLEEIKNDLNSFIWQFNFQSRKENRTDGVILYLTLDKDDPVQIVAKGKSAVNGPWYVEDMSVKGKLYRRLTFLSSQNLFQTEVPLTKKKKGRKVVDLDDLASEYHKTMLAALAFIPDFSSKAKNKGEDLRLAILGLGGGAFPSFLSRRLPAAHILSIEYDEEVVKIAKKYFNLRVGTNGVDVKVEDALDFLKNVAEHENDPDQILDAIFVDVAGSMDSEGMSCPPSTFVTEEALNLMFQSLSESGVLAMNVVTRDEEVSERLKKVFRKFFSNVFSIANAESVNEVLICPKSNITLKRARKLMNLGSDQIDLLESIAVSMQDLKFC